MDRDLTGFVRRIRQPVPVRREHEPPLMKRRFLERCRFAVPVHRENHDVAGRVRALKKRQHTIRRPGPRVLRASLSVKRSGSPLPSAAVKYRFSWPPQILELNTISVLSGLQANGRPGHLATRYSASINRVAIAAVNNIKSLSSERTVWRDFYVLYC